MINRIPQMKWLDDKTKEYAIKKVVKMTDNIGYPDYIMNPEKLSEDYEGFETTPNDYFTNMINFDSFSFGKNLKLFKQQYDNDRWHMTPQTINAYYYLLNNSMNFPAGIFQSPFYHSNDPDYLNYGSIGMVIGHELTHAFDNNGKNYDEDGKFSNWWSDSSLKKFEELSQCFINQYSKFYITDKYGRKYYVNGKNTLGENLADNGGLARAYEAWKISISKDPEHAVERNKALPGLSDYSYDQLFYISFGQGWCINATPEYVISKIENDVHSPAQFRVNGVVSNSEHFAKTFNCQKNAPMNPNNKCLIW
ncbi:zincin [Anaeromyces robustus]|uniref:Zincin n=1 Tax=Anaeromyces robustus TaxID=1754192 RepID=A0A1Y1VSZ6_9FUNG|nr:zincin [Anaeromyces robustus]|eukprot:ORX64409.1 zincin [Anaeromyces robustus]